MTSTYSLQFKGPLAKAERFFASNYWLTLEQGGIPGHKLKEWLTKEHVHYFCLNFQKWYDVGKDRCTCLVKQLEKRRLQLHAYLQSTQVASRASLRGYNVFFTFQSLEDDRFRKQQGVTSPIPYHEEIAYHVELEEVQYAGRAQSMGKTYGIWYGRPINRQTRIPDPIPVEVLRNLTEELKPIAMVEQASRNLARIRHYQSEADIYKKENARVRFDDRLVKERSETVEGYALRNPLNPQPIRYQAPSPVTSSPLFWIIGLGFIGWIVSRAFFPTGYDAYDPTTVTVVFVAAFAALGFMFHKWRMRG